MMNTMTKVTTELVEFITSCHVSEKWKRGPSTAQRMTSAKASPVAAGVAVKSSTAPAIQTYHVLIDRPYTVNVWPPNGRICRLSPSRSPDLRLQADLT